MKTAVVILYVLVVILIIISLMNWNAISNLKPVVTTAANKVEVAAQKVANDSAPFAETLNAMKEATAKSFTIQF